MSLPNEAPYRPHDNLPELRKAAQGEVGKVVLSHDKAVELTLIAASKANARLSGRDEVEVEDVVEMAPYVLRHRIVAEGTGGEEVVRHALESVLSEPRTDHARAGRRK